MISDSFTRAHKSGWVFRYYCGPTTGWKLIGGRKLLKDGTELELSSIGDQWIARVFDPQGWQSRFVRHSPAAALGAASFYVRHGVYPRPPTRPPPIFRNPHTGPRVALRTVSFRRG